MHRVCFSPLLFFCLQCAVQVDFDEFAAWMMGPSKHAATLRHNLHSAALGGMTFDSLVDDDVVQRSAQESMS